MLKDLLDWIGNVSIDELSKTTLTIFYNCEDLLEKDTEKIKNGVKLSNIENAKMFDSSLFFAFCSYAIDFMIKMRQKLMPGVPDDFFNPDEMLKDSLILISDQIANEKTNGWILEEEYKQLVNISAEKAWEIPCPEFLDWSINNEISPRSMLYFLTKIEIDSGVKDVLDRL